MGDKTPGNTITPRQPDPRKTKTNTTPTPKGADETKTTPNLQACGRNFNNNDNNNNNKNKYPGHSKIMDTASIMDISMIMDTARTIDKAIPIMMTMITIIIAIVMTIIMITMNIKARSRERVYQRYLKDPRVPRVPGVLVHGDNRSDVLYDFKYVYVEKIRVFVDSQTWKIILSLCLYGHVW